MKILHVTHTDITQDSRILKELEAVASLENSGVEGWGIAKSASQQTILDGNATLRNFGLATNGSTWIPRAFRYFWQTIIITIKFCISAREFRPDIIHCHDTMVLFIGVYCKIFFGSVLIYDAHELESDKNGQNKVLSLATLFVERICWSRIDHLITVSDSIGDFYNTSFNPKPTIIVLNSPKLQPSGAALIPHADLRLRYDILADEAIFVYVGLLSSGRGISEILSVFSSSTPPGHVVFVGDGEFEETIKSYTVSHSNIHLHEKVVHDVVVSLLSSADVGLCLLEYSSKSDYYALPNKLFEYAFAGLPTIASNFPELQKTVNKYGLGFCVPPTEEGLKSIKQADIKRLEPITHESLAELSWTAQAEKLRTMYHHISTYVS